MYRSLSVGVLVCASLVPSERGLGQAKWTDAEKIANAMTAAPRFISENAAIVEIQDGKPVTLRAGTNGWTCMPTNPTRDGNEPMCMDEEWMSFMNAKQTKTTPHVKHAGVSYMLAPGGPPVSNTDPYAEKATPDNEWGSDGPHVMVLVPQPHELQGIPTKRHSGPWVMWAGTAYAHLMVPFGPPKP